MRKSYNFISLAMTEVEPLPRLSDQLNSPTRTATQSITKPSLARTRADDNFTLSSNFPTPPAPTPLSVTQKQIYSHSLIKQIVDKSKRNTIQHDVNRIPAGTQLYNVPLEEDPNQFVFDAIPPNNHYFVSDSSQKVQEIHHRLSDNRDLSERLVELAERNLQLLTERKSKRPSTADNTDRRVSISGLVSYNFNSVTARRSLGSIPDLPQDEVLARKKQQVKRRNSCIVDRQAKIIKRKPTPQNTNKLQLAKAMVCEFTSPTDKFLKNLVVQNQRKYPIYGQKMQKLLCIKEYMEKQKTDYEHAQFIVQAIVNSQKKEKKQRPKKEKIPVDDQFQLSKRKRAVSRKVMLKHLYFTQ